jgi:glutamate synthase (NADPH/NADH) large chain
MVHHPNWGHPDHDACGTGFVARLGGPPNHDIIRISLTALERLSHRGGVDADGASGDGAGLLAALPRDFFRARAQEQGIELAESFGLGMTFFPGSVATLAREAVEAAAQTEQLRVLGWRRVPVNSNALGQRALETLPEIWQFFVEPAAPVEPDRFDSRFESRLALLRRIAIARALLYLLAIVADGCLQRPAHSVAVSAIL